MKINDSVMESSCICGQVKIPHRTMIYLERELAPREPEIMHRMDLRGLDFLKILQMSLDRNYWALLAIGCDWAAEGWNPGVRWDECLMWTGWILECV